MVWKRLHEGGDWENWEKGVRRVYRNQHVKRHKNGQVSGSGTCLVNHSVW